jgi:hypothetical protein
MIMAFSNPEDGGMDYLKTEAALIFPVYLYPNHSYLPLHVVSVLRIQHEVNQIVPTSLAIVPRPSWPIRNTPNTHIRCVCKAKSVSFARIATTITSRK